MGTEVTQVLQGRFRTNDGPMIHANWAHQIDICITAYLSYSEYPNPLEMPCVQEIARAHGKTPGQILVRHELQRGLVVIPKSTHPTRIQDNINVRTAC